MADTSAPARGTAAGSPSRRASHCATRSRDDPRAALRRPGAGAQRLSHDPRSAAGHRGRRRGRGRAAGDRARGRSPDVILMDVRMPNLDGVEATRRLVAAGSPARIVILTTFDLDEYVYDAIRAGASGVLLKDARPAQLVDAIEVVAGGGALLAPAVTRRLLDWFAETLPGGAREPPPALSSLTEREREVLRLLAGGLSNAELAERLVLSETTVKSHVSSVLRKLDVRDRVQAVVLAYEAGLVRVGER